MKFTVTDNVPPSDLSNASIFQLIELIVPLANAAVVDVPPERSPIATNTSLSADALSFPPAAAVQPPAVA